MPLQQAICLGQKWPELQGIDPALSYGFVAWLWQLHYQDEMAWKSIVPGELSFLGNCTIARMNRCR